MGNPQYGRPLYLGIAFFVLLSILLITPFGRGFVRNISVLLGLIIGTIVAALLGQVDFSRMSDSAWFAVVMPFFYGCRSSTRSPARPCALSWSLL